MLKRNRVVDLRSTSKDDVLREMVDVAATSPYVLDKEALLKSVMEREAKMTTGIGIGIAIPHAKTNACTDFVIAIGRKKGGLVYDALDGGLVYLVVMIAGPASRYDTYLNIHAKIVLLMACPEFRQRLINAETSDDIYHLLKGK